MGAVRRPSNRSDPEAEALRRLLEIGKPADMFDWAVRDRVGKFIANAATSSKRGPQAQPQQQPQKKFKNKP